MGVDHSKKINLLNLVALAFGPYPEERILAPSFASNLSRTKKRPVLHEVYMEKKGDTWKATGLDFTEVVETAQEKLDVRFFGVLVIDDLRWLSPQGYEWLEQDLRDRDKKVNRIKKSGLTLKSVYGFRPDEGSKMRVWVQGKKTRPASYLTVENDPNSLIFQSNCTDRAYNRAVYRDYRIQSLDCKTNSLSQKFLTRFRLLAFVKMTIADKPPPIEERTVSWLVDKMITYNQEQTRKHRFIFDRSDPNVNEEGFTNCPRRPRHISRAEVKRLLAKHAEWFLAQQLVTSSRTHHLVDLPDLYKFCCLVRGNDNLNLGPRFGLNNWKERVKRFCCTNNVKRSAVVEVVEECTSKKMQVGFQYDDDFSVVSSGSDHDSDSDFKHDRCELAKRIPRFCFSEPRLNCRFLWHCPAPECNYFLNFLQPLTISGNISPEDYAFLIERRWDLDDKRLMVIFSCLVSEHYHEHMRAKGVDIIERRGKVLLVPWPEEAPMEGIGENFVNVKAEMY